MPAFPPLRQATRPATTQPRDRALAECLAGAHAVKAGKIDKAMMRYATAVALAPQDADVAAFHGVALRHAGRFREAQRELIRAIALDVRRADSYTQLAQTYVMVGDRAQAAQAYIAAATLQPDNAIAWRDAAEAFRLSGRLADGLDTARHAAALAPTDATIANTLALLLHRNNQLDAALALCESARQLAPDDRNLALTHAMLLRTFGEYTQGWALHERRLELPELAQRPYPPATPRWNGGPLTGRHILVRAEQGLGDQVQFARWACTLRERGATRVTVQTATPLVRLLRTAPFLDDVVAADRPAPPHHVHVDVMSLPHLLGTGNDMLAGMVPYLHAPDDPPSVVRTLPDRPSGARRIGVVWGGTPLHTEDRSRSMPLNAMLPLLARRDLQIVVLQQGAVREQLNELAPAIRASLLDVALECGDMGDTAHIMTACDIVLTVDTSVAHVAGALGCATWVMVSEPAEWRWGIARSDSPFYPTLRVFRQPRPGDWTGVIQQVSQAIDALPPLSAGGA